MPSSRNAAIILQSGLTASRASAVACPRERFTCSRILRGRGGSLSRWRTHCWKMRELRLFPVLRLERLERDTCVSRLQTHWTIFVRLWTGWRSGRRRTFYKECVLMLESPLASGLSLCDMNVAKPICGEEKNDVTDRKFR